MIGQQARRCGCRVFTIGRDLQSKIISRDLSGSCFSFQGLEHYWPRLQSRLPGEHQVVNASLAAAVAEYFLGERSRPAVSAVTRGIAQARWPARLEVLTTKPLTVIDSAHNRDSAQKLKKAVTELFPKKKIVLIFGASRDKDIPGILRELKGLSREVILTRASHPRSFVFSKRPKALVKNSHTYITENARKALVLARRIASNDGIILVAGSVFLAGEIRKLCLSRT